MNATEARTAAVRAAPAAASDAGPAGGSARSA